MIKIRSPRFILISELLLFTLCILIFAFFASHDFPYFLISLGGLFIAAIIIVKDIMLKGSGIDMVWKETLVIMGFAMFFIFMSLKKFSIRLG